MKTMTIFIAFLVMLSPLNAQSLTLHECITKALSTHPDIKKFILQVEQSRYAKDAIKADNRPQISLNAEYDPTHTFTMTQNGAFDTTQASGWQGGVNINQKIWDFSKTSFAIKAAQKSENIAALSLKDARALLVYYVKLQYEQIRVQKEAILVREQDMKSKKELYEQAKALLKQGIKTKADTTRFLSAFYNAKDNLSIAHANLEKARIALATLIGEPIKKDVTLDAMIYKNTKEIMHLNNASMLEHNPQLQEIKETIDKNKYLYQEAKASRYGSIDASLSYSHQDILYRYNNSIVGISFKIPLYSGGRTAAVIQQAKISQEISKRAYQSKKLALQQELAQLLTDFKRYNTTIASKKVQLEASIQTKQLIEARYKEGLSTYIEVLDAISLYLNAKLGLIEAHYEQHNIINRIEYLQGKTL
ncbi:TolC family protein [Sulfurospirillum sp. 1612]|uniref:TolC family protein n=1 Tax=Sulfurospirillum sp. 1612 TaxID=3094835 RepID=UPI002F954AA7